MYNSSENRGTYRVNYFKSTYIKNPNSSLKTTGFYLSIGNVLKFNFRDAQ